MSIRSTGLYGSATIVNSDLFNDVEDLKEQVTTLSTSYLTTTQEHREDKGCPVGDAVAPGAEEEGQRQPDYPRQDREGDCRYHRYHQDV